MNKTIFERLLQGETIPFSDPDYMEIRKACAENKPLLLKANQSADAKEVILLLNQMANGKIAESATVYTPFHTNYGGNISIGENVFVNHDCSFLDLGGITIDDGVMIGPKVVISSEGHPIAPAQRNSLSAGKVHIKRNAWIGANVTILPNVIIGENSVVAAGAVVSRDVPDNVIAGGVPAKIIRQL
ncbi:sugar O-acetyltransferase [Proteiniphilum sp. X52]|uniref:sugar O-acetyltransferase n=1 Tax=Proteiniphilum sp. X52 TaxID=2382159 RepID=UPI000F0A5E86|nr:sugar O-acetyltransferase [Proteiniphilum sp. X52]RNC67162.1 sugar O-acetyltransferase [Proteiniphilum sp. X52]